METTFSDVSRVENGCVISKKAFLPSDRHGPYQAVQAF